MLVRPCTLSQANALITGMHRHHKKVQGHRFSLSAYDGDRLCGVACIGRPVSASVDAYYVAEVTRLCTDGTKNACSILYAAAARAAQAMGYDRIQTYILESESGTSLKASGWIMDGLSSGHSWTTMKRTRNADQDGTIKQRWAKVFSPQAAQATRTDK